MKTVAEIVLRQLILFACYCNLSLIQTVGVTAYRGTVVAGGDLDVGIM